MKREQIKSLYSIIDQILWSDWDPIGINDDPEARDEYQNYLPQVYGLKIKNADQETIANYLFKIETENMGLIGDFEKCRRVAYKILIA